MLVISGAPENSLLCSLIHKYCSFFVSNMLTLIGTGSERSLLTFRALNAWDIQCVLFGATRPALLMKVLLSDTMPGKSLSMLNTAISLFLFCVLLLIS